MLDYNTNFKSTAQLGSLYAPDGYRASDHDPVVVSLDLTCPAQPAPATQGWPLGWLVLVLSLSGAAALRSSVRPGG